MGRILINGRRRSDSSCTPEGPRRKGGGRLYREIPPPDLIITDILMPDQDGVEALLDLKNILPDVIQPPARSRAISNLTQTFNAVEKSIEGFTQGSLGKAQEHVRSKRFMDTFKSANRKGGLEQMVGDVDTLSARSS